MPILNYTTSIASEKTIMEIQKLLSSKGAKSIMVDYENGLPTALSFAIWKENEIPINFRLPASYKGVLATMKRDNVPNRYSNDEQALKVSWRIVKDWIKAQLALIDSGQASMKQVLLPYAVTDDGRTLSERVLSPDTDLKLLQ